jgi:hypothetical protein
MLEKGEFISFGMLFFMRLSTLLLASIQMPVHDSVQKSFSFLLPYSVLDLGTIIPLIDLIMIPYVSLINI